MNLASYQHVGALKLAANYHHVLGDVPGLGKTPQLIVAADAVGARDVLVTCPASVRSGWARQLAAWAKHGGEGWEVISYNEAGGLAAEPLKKHYDVFIPDEVHFCKTVESQRTQAIFGTTDGLARRADYKWPASGTLVLNRPAELYPLLKTLFTGAIAPYDTRAKFEQRFCGAYFNGHGMDARGHSNLDDLARRIAPHVTRRTKQQAFPNWPEPVIEKVALKASAADMRPVYDVENLISNRESYLSPAHEKFGQLGDLAQLLHATGIAKVRLVTEFVKQLLTSRRKVGVFAHHREVLKRLHLELGLSGFGPVLYTGGMNDAQKDAALRTFRFDKASRVFLGQLRAAGTGINGLQEVCRDAVFAEYSWVPGEIRQGIDRFDRLDENGQYPTEPVRAWMPVLEGSMEAAVLGAHRIKSWVEEQILPVGAA